MAELPEHQVPGVYRRRIGDIVVTAVADGFLDGDVDVLKNITPDDAREILSASFRPARSTAVNTFLLQTKNRVALIETGCGTYMQPTAGKLMSNLAAAGVAPSDVEAVLLTHMHPDHSAGLTDRDSGKPFFANAELVVHENEPKHWLDDASMARASRSRPIVTACVCLPAARSFRALRQSRAPATHRATPRS